MNLSSSIELNIPPSLLSILIIFNSFNSLINKDPTAIEVFNEKYDEKQLQSLFKTYRETEQLESSAPWVSEIFDTLLRNENDPSNQPFEYFFREF